MSFFFFMCLITSVNKDAATPILDISLILKEQRKTITPGSLLVTFDFTKLRKPCLSQVVFKSGFV